MITVKYQPYYSDKVEELTLKYAYYTNGNLAVHAFDKDGYPFQNVTTNFADQLPYGCAYIDDNNFPGIIELLEENNIAKDTGVIKVSGFCVYRMYNFAEGVLLNDR